MKKRILGAILTLCMLMAFVPCIASAETSGTCGDNVTWTLDNGTLTISGEGEITSTPWSTYSNDILKVVICENITTIPTFAFSYFSNLKEVSLPDTLEKIASYAFAWCKNLKQLHIPKNVKEIMDFTFRYNYFESIEVDADNQYFSSLNGDLYNKDKTTLVCYAAGKSDEAYVSPAGVTTMGRGAMSGVKNLKTITLSDDVTEIGINAFSNTSLLETINIGANVKSIGNLAIYNNTNLTNINVNENNQYFCDVDGVLFNKSMTELVKYPEAKSNTVYNIPEGTEIIQNYAFSLSSNLEKVTIPQSVNKIYGEAFYFCDNLKSIDVDENNSDYCTVDGDLYTKDKKTLCRYTMGKSDESFTIPNYVNTIDDSALCGCRNLNNIIIPETVTSLGSNAFEDNTFTEITIPNSITVIPPNTFLSCHNLERVNLPKSITNINTDAFESCESLSDVYYAGSEEEWEEISIDSGNSYLTNATIHYNSNSDSNNNDNSGNNDNSDSEPAVSEATVTVSNGEYTFNVIIDNVPQGSQILTAVYENGVLKGFTPTTVTADDNGKTKSVTVSADSADSAKVFIWGSLEDLSPLCGSTTIQKNEFITQ